jgi:hypothetical protein
MTNCEFGKILNTNNKYIKKQLIFLSKLLRKLLLIILPK